MTVAAPQVGDAEFHAFADRHVNMRRVVYQGSAQREDIQEDRVWTYGFGDFVPSLPLACPNLSMPGES